MATAYIIFTYIVVVPKCFLFVIPAKAGIQNYLKTLDSRFHGNDSQRLLKQFMDRHYITVSQSVKGHVVLQK